jgi:Caspase domain
MHDSRHSLKTLALSALAVVGLGLSAQAQAPLDVRIALVIGNSAYAGAPLVNPANDARGMSDTLRGLGFTVVELRDAQKAQMVDAIAKVRDSLKGKQGVGMLYYAGHGLQLDWHNYMVPVDAKMSKAADVVDQTVDINSVIDAFKGAGNRMNILVLDACRDNPFAGTATGKGLAQLDAPPGTFLAYATAPGNVAEDGEAMRDGKNGNGLYTQFLLEELKKPVSKIEDVFKRVRLQVRQKSQGRQIPWESTSLEDDFFFNTGKVMAVAKPDEKLREVAFNAEKSDWDKVKDSRAADDVYAFLQKYPSGSFSELAQTRIERLQKAQITVQADREGRVQGSFDQRFRDGDRYEFVQKDGMTGVVIANAVLETRFKGDDEVEAVALSGNLPGSRATRAGFVLQDGGGTYDPPWSSVPSGEFQIGKRLSGRSIRTAPDGSKQWVDYDSHIAAREKLKTAFGEIDTFRVDVNFVYQNGGRSKFTFWYDPDWGYSVKLSTEFRNARGKLDIRIREMVARSRKG